MYICFIVLFTSKAGTKRSANAWCTLLLWMVDACTGVSFLWSYHHKKCFLKVNPSVTHTHNMKWKWHIMLMNTLYTAFIDK